MNKVFKKSVAVLCALITLIGMVALPASAATTSDNDLPTVYLVGAGGKVYDKNGKKVWPVRSIETILKENGSELVSSFASCLMSSDWAAYGDTINAIIGKYFEGCKLDKNGNPINGTYIKKSAKPAVKKSGYGLMDYEFKFDPRLDPWETAEELSAYIDAVLKATGKKKVNLVGRCLGACYISAYLCRYGCSKIDNAIYLASAAKGSTVASEVFSGKLDFNSDAINNYATDYMDDDEVSELLSGIVNVTYSLNMLGFGTDFVTEIFEELSKESFPEILLTAFAGMPSYWAMVSVEHYEDAKNFIFGPEGSEKRKEYANFIKKIDNYHKKVKVPLDSKLKQFKKSGMKIEIIAKYNTPFIPILESHSVQGDAKISLKDISFGATGAEIGKTLSASYINSVKEKGKVKYISEDLIVDASTCLFPDYTWFIRDLGHSSTPTALNKLLIRILKNKYQSTVTSFKEYPQYTSFNFDTRKLDPITEPISNATGTTQTGGIFNIVNLFSAMIKIMRNFFTILFNGDA